MTLKDVIGMIDDTIKTTELYYSGSIMYKDVYPDTCLNDNVSWFTWYPFEGKIEVHF